MNIPDKVRDTFLDHQIGTEWSRQEVIDTVIQKHSCNPKSVIPSDYCYNRTNDGIDFKKSLHIFEYLGTATYRYLGEGYPYTGEIYQQPKGYRYEIVVGEWKDGKLSADF